MKYSNQVMNHTCILAVLVIAALQACANQPNSSSLSLKTMSDTTAKEGNPYYSKTDTTVLHVSDAEWKKVLSSDLYAVAREAHTERAFTGKFWDFEGIGLYRCACCGNALFRSDSKFASSCGWPSFFESIRPNSCSYKADNSYGMRRIEVNCGRCDAHLGHIFDDGPPPTYKRFCMNSISLDFEPNQ